jgi:hypothetical protein
VTAYLRFLTGERVLLDTSKCKLVFEETEYDLTGATIDFYEVEFKVADGYIGTEQREAKVFAIRDPFTGLSVEVPFEMSSAKAVGQGFLKGAKRKLLRG